jgi:predicted  nucleic acid-binding Zn-ribbon protein
MTLIEDLLTLYSVERRLRGLRSRVESAETYLRVQQRQLNALQERREELETHKRQRQAHAGNLETEAAAVDERTEKLREELNAASNTRQYHAVLNEVNSLKDKRKEFDEQTLAEMAAVEKIEEELTVLETQTAERKKVLDSAEEELESRRAEIKDSLAEMEAERDEKSAAIPSDTQRLFDDLADDFDGDAMASIELIDKRRREYACNTCNVHLPFDIVNRVTGRPDEVVQCQGCLRILYASEDCREALVK